MHCQDRLLDCGVLHNFVPEAATDDFCHRLCPLPSAGREAPGQNFLPPFPPHHRPNLHQLPFFQRNAIDDSIRPNSVDNSIRRNVLDDQNEIIAYGKSRTITPQDNSRQINRFINTRNPLNDLKLSR